MIGMVSVFLGFEGAIKVTRYFQLDMYNFFEKRINVQFLVKLL